MLKIVYSTSRSLVKSGCNGASLPDLCVATLPSVKLRRRTLQLSYLKDNLAENILNLYYSLTYDFFYTKNA